LNPFGQIKHEREDAVPGYVEMSDGKVYAGNVYMTRDKRVKIYDEKMKRQREIPLQRIKEIECKVLKEWIEKEWRFKELALDEKMYTGRSYPAREYDHTVTLADGRKISGQLSEILYVQPILYSADEPMSYRPNVDPDKFLLHKRQKGETGADLKSLVYVKRIRLGEEAYKEGKEKAARRLGAPAKAEKSSEKKPVEKRPTRKTEEKEAASDDSERKEKEDSENK